MKRYNLEVFKQWNVLQVLYEHHAEVWCLEFSPCGQYLASGAKSNSTFVWKVDAAGHRLTLHWRFQVPADVTGISSISWSADSRYIAVASSEENASGVFIYDVQRGCMVGNYQPTPASSFSVVSFFKDGSHRFACGDQRGNFNACVSRLVFIWCFRLIFQTFFFGMLFFKFQLFFFV